jgi:hypothetical protein
MVDELKNKILQGTFSYQPIVDKNSSIYAEKILQNKGFENTLAQWRGVVNGQHLADKRDIALGERLCIEAANAGNIDLASKLAAEIAVEGTQTVQAMRLLKKIGPAGQSYYIDTVVNQLNEDILYRFNNRQQPIRVDETLKRKLLSAKTQEEMDKVIDKIYQNIAD